MFEKKNVPTDPKQAYQLLLESGTALFSNDYPWIANLSNASALLHVFLRDINWVGFYLAKKDMLYLGPFQGLPACVEIPFGKGVCGTAAQSRLTQRIEDVHTFEGHIACDSASNSEIVIPMMVNNELIGVLDIDSPLFSRFTTLDQHYLEEFVRVLLTFYKESLI